MPDALKEFLVGLGFKVDGATYKVFKDSVAAATKEVTALGGEAIAAATEVAYMVNRVAKEYEQLYYVSQRTGSSVAGIKSFGYAGQQVGVAYEEAQSAIEGFGQAVRLNPGLGALLRAQGIDPKNSEQAILAFIQRQKKAFGEQGYFAAANQAQQLFGIGEKTFRQFWVNMDKTVAKRKEYQGMLREAGFDADEAAPRFLRFSNSVSTLWARFGVLTDRIASDFLPTAEQAVGWADRMLKKFSEFNKEHGGVPGQVAAGAAAFGPMLIFKRFRSMLGKAVGGGGLLGLGLEGLMAVKYDAAHGNEGRSWLRDLLGIEETKEEKKANPSWWPKKGESKSFGDLWGAVGQGFTAGSGPKPFSLGDIASALSPGGAAASVIAPTIRSETNINILPGPTAWDTAQAVFMAQNDVNSNTVRLFGNNWKQ